MTIVPIVIGAFGTITKGLLKGLEDLEVGGQVETIQNDCITEYWEESWRLEETCCHSNSSKSPSANADVKNSKGVNNNNNNKEKKKKNIQFVKKVINLLINSISHRKK